MSFLFGGGSNNETVTQTQQLSPQQQQLLSQLTGQEQQLFPIVSNLLNLLPAQENAVYNSSVANPMQVQNAVMSNLTGGNYTPATPGPALNVPMNLSATPPTPTPDQNTLQSAIQTALKNLGVGGSTLPMNNFGGGSAAVMAQGLRGINGQ